VPPRFAYWTILIDNAPTAFRAREAEELLPTVAQLKRTNPNVIMKWFARGKLWESQQQERDDFQRRKWRPADRRSGSASGDRPERRSREWRPGGDHKDPRARFSKEKRRQAKPAVGAKPWAQKPPGGNKPWQKKAERRGKPWRGDVKPGDRPWHAKPKGDVKPWQQDNKFRPRKPPGQSFKTKWKKANEPPRKRDTPEDE
jgi:hypothetical protein